LLVHRGTRSPFGTDTSQQRSAISLLPIIDLPYFAGLCAYDQDRGGAKIAAAGEITVERDDPTRPMTQRVERGKI
jgi:hypothetical protein